MLLNRRRILTTKKEKLSKRRRKYKRSSLCDKKTAVCVYGFWLILKQKSLIMTANTHISAAAIFIYNKCVLNYYYTSLLGCILRWSGMSFINFPSCALSCIPYLWFCGRSTGNYLSSCLLFNWGLQLLLLFDCPQMMIIRRQGGRSRLMHFFLG